MQSIEQFVERAAQTKHGFTDIKRAAEEITSEAPPAAALKLAHQLFRSEVPQARMLAVFVFGHHAAEARETLDFLRNTVSADPNWRVQEILAQAFDTYAAATGYEKALPVIEAWLQADNPNVRRAVTEGLRIWTSRDYFRQHPEVAIRLLSQQRSHDSEYLRKSVGNALRDISRKHGDLIREELATWDLKDKRAAQVYKLAHQFLKGD